MVTALAATMLALSSGAPAQAALGSLSVSLSNNQVNGAATYTALFTTGSAAVTDLLVALPGTVTVPASPTVAVSTASTCTGTFSSASIGTVATNLSGSGNSIGVPLSSAIASAGTCVKIVVSGLTNPGTTGTLYACLADGTGALANVTSTNLAGITCSVSGLGGTINALLGILDNAAAAITFVAETTNGVTNNLSIAPVLTMGVDNTSNSFSITPSASGVTASSALTDVTVATNAVNYTVQAVVSGASSVLTLTGDNTKTIPLKFRQSTGGSAPACDGSSETSLGAGGTYSTVASSVAGLTNGKVTNVRYCWTVDLTKPAGTYTATITYLAVPSF